MVDFARALPLMRERVQRDLEDATTSAASACWPAPCGCSTAASSASAARTTRSRTRATGWRRCARSHVTLNGGELDRASTIRRRAASGACSRSSTPRCAEIVARAQAAPRRAATSCSPTSDDGRWRRRQVRRHQRVREGRSTGGDFSAKDFRTWNATVLAAVALAVSGRGGGDEDGAQARGHARGQGGRRLPGQHAGGGARHATSTRACSTASTTG